jgi:AcrR family transcriptional regulator
MTIDDIASEVGIGKGSVYLHFKSKQEIALSHVDRIIERLCVRLSNIAGGDAAPDEKLRRIVLERVSFRFDSVQHYSESINELLSSLRSSLLPLRQKHHQKEAKIIAKVISEGQTEGIFSDAPPLETAKVFITATNALLPFGLSSEELHQRAEIEAKATGVIELLLRGISNK